MRDLNAREKKALHPGATASSVAARVFFLASSRALSLETRLAWDARAAYTSSFSLSRRPHSEACSWDPCSYTASRSATAASRVFSFSSCSSS